MRTKQTLSGQGAGSLSLALCLAFSLFGCSSVLRKAPKADQIARVALFCDNMDVANTMAAHLAKKSNAAVTTTTDPWTLVETDRFDAVILAHVERQQLPDEAIAALRRFVRNGGGLIGIHDAIFLTNKPLEDVFGGSAGVFPTDIVSEALTLRVRRPAANHPVVRELPSAFALRGEHATASTTVRGATVLMNETYTTSASYNPEFAAVWIHPYGSGLALFITPGHFAETRYNEHILRLIANTIAFMKERRPSGMAGMRSRSGTD